LLPTSDIATLFADEMSGLGGRVSDSFDDGDRLICRAILPDVRDVRPADRVNAGMALMAMGAEIRVHPYVFRQVCTNGAIMAQTTQSRRIPMPEWASEVPDVAEEVRLAVRACGSTEAFEVGVSGMRRGADPAADYLVTVMPLLARIPERMRAEVLRPILARFAAEGNSAFSLMNAVTSVARDSRDPDTRWRLEELGGAIATTIAVGPTRRPAPAAAAAAAAAVPDEIMELV